MTTKTLTTEILSKDGSEDLADGEFLAVMSDPSVDRDGEIIAAGAFDPLPGRIPVEADHAISVRSIVGSGVPFYDGDRLMIRGSFADTELGREVRSLVRDGHVDKMSVVFGSAEYGEKDGATGADVIVKGELLNVGFVSIPSNRNAAVIEAKSSEEISTPPVGEDATGAPYDVEESAATAADIDARQRSRAAMTGAHMAHARLTRTELHDCD